MSDTAQRRDLSDPKTVRDFVDAVQSPELLKLLLVLTSADIRAVGPGVWNAWKGQLLRALYDEAEAVMSGEDPTSGHAVRISRAKQNLVERIADLPESERERAMSRHHDAYWLAFDASAHERGARLAAATDASAETFGFSAETNVARGVTEIVVYTPDRPGLFAQLAGAISGSGGSISDAKAFTTTDGFAFDLFSVQDAEGGPFGDGARVERLRQTITRTLDGKAPPRTMRAHRSDSTRVRAFRVHPRVTFNNDASTTATVMEVQAADRPGLLHDVARAIFESGLSISSAMVATYGERAMDVFYVRDAYGHKVTLPARLASVEAPVMSALLDTTT